MENIYLLIAIMFSLLTWMSYRIASKHRVRKNTPGCIAFGIQTVVFGLIAVVTACNYFL